MKRVSTLPTVIFFALVTSASIESLFAASATNPPPPPPPSPMMGAKNCPNALSASAVGQLLRAGEKAGVITRHEGLSEEEVVAAMMSQKAPAKIEAAKPTTKKVPAGNKSQQQMMEELNKRLAQKPEERKALRQSAPGRMEANPEEQTQAEKPEWMKNLRKRPTKTPPTTPRDDMSGQADEDPTKWRSRLRKSTGDVAEN